MISYVRYMLTHTYDKGSISQTIATDKDT